MSQIHDRCQIRENKKKRKTTDYSGEGKSEKQGGSKSQKRFHKQLISALKELSEPEEQAPKEDEKGDYNMLVSALQEVMSTKQGKAGLPPAPAAKQPAKPASRLNSIIDRLRQK